MHVSELVDKRQSLRTDADALLTRAADEARDLTPDELREHAGIVAEIREVEDRLDAARDAEIRELRAAALAAATTAPTGPVENRYGHWLLEQRANTVDSSTMSGKGRTPLVNDTQTSWFDLVRPQSRLLDGFAWPVIQTDRSQVDVPKLKADGVAAATNEGADITGNAAFDVESILVTPAKYSSYEALSVEVWQDSEPSLLEGFGRGIVRRHALAWEAALVAALEASATVVATDANFATSLDVISDTLVTMQAAGANPAGIVTTAAVAQTLLKLKEVSGSTKPVLMDNGPADGFAGRVLGLPLIVSSAVTATKAVIFDPAHTLLVIRRSPTIEVSTDALFGTDSVAVRAISRFAAKTMNATGAYILTDTP
jgi:HK97 family phage major capsid protein